MTRNRSSGSSGSISRWLPGGAVAAGSGRVGCRTRGEKPIDATISPPFRDGQHIAAEDVVDPLRGGIVRPFSEVCVARPEHGDAAFLRAIRTGTAARNLRIVAKLPLRFAPPGPAVCGEAVVPSRFEYRTGLTARRARGQGSELVARLAGFLNELVHPFNEILGVPSLLIEFGPFGVFLVIASELFSLLRQAVPMRASILQAFGGDP